MPLTGSSIVHPKLHEKATGWRARGLPDACVITRATAGQGPLNPVTGVRTPQDPTTVYTGPCTAQPAPASERAVDTGDDRITVRRYYVSVCADADPIDIDDVVTITRTRDLGMFGRPMVVTDVQYDTFQSRRLLSCEDRGGIQP